MLTAEQHKLNIDVRPVAVKDKYPPLISVRLSLWDEYAS
jgi:hypothetical protein